MNQLKPELVLRLSLALTYFYSGFNLIISPASWTEFVPRWLETFLANLNFPLSAFLQIQGGGEILLALILIAWFASRRLVFGAALLSTIEMASILVFSGINLITFRDIGLLGVSSGILLLYRRSN